MALTAEQQREQENTGTKQVADAHRFDEAKLAKWMDANVEGYQGPLEVRQFKGGQSNPTYQLVTPNKKYVLRRKPPGKLLPSAHAVDREYRVLSALYPTGFPVARTYGLCRDEEVIGTMFYVMDMVEGRILWDQSLPDYTPEERRPIYMAQVKTLGRPAQHRLPGHRPWRLRQAGQLFRPPDPPLDPSVQGLRDDRYPRGRQADRVVAAHRA